MTYTPDTTNTLITARMMLRLAMHIARDSKQALDAFVGGRTTFPIKRSQTAGDVAEFVNDVLAPAWERILADAKPYEFRKPSYLSEYEVEEWGGLKGEILFRYEITLDAVIARLTICRVAKPTPAAPGAIDGPGPAAGVE